MFCIPVVDRIHPARRPADSSESVSGPMAPALTKRFFHFTNFQGPRTRCGALEVFETGFCFARREEIGEGLVKHWTRAYIKSTAYVSPPMS